MRVIVGLGNPGNIYKNTRHNVGFEVLDKISNRHGFDFETSKEFNALIANYNLLKHKFIFVKPQTFMNLSGTTVKKIVDFFNLDVKKLLVFHDDIWIEMGNIKFRYSGSCCGHNGVMNIIKHLKDENFARFKIGTGFPPYHTSRSEFVLKRFNSQEKNIIDKIIDDVSKNFIDLLKSKHFV
ncbi:MAG: aminoacyl-tRNA hydrolase [Clostridiales bacterium]|jgi:PTH1 family peptidyl-tRNA hydrolase|nr:aminoacyl-tRNA hydrolase [Clostridiales bacterium]